MVKNLVAAEQSIETPAHMSYAMKDISPGVFIFYERNESEVISCNLE